MKYFKAKTKDPRTNVADYRLSVGLLVSFGIIVSILMYTFWKHSEKTEFNQGKIDQINRIESLSRKLETFSIIATQLSNFIRENINSKKLTPNEIENRLKEYLRSAPQDTIYGIGIWFNPFQLHPKRTFYGPYVHRDIQNGMTLTHEWETVEYNYPNQPWFIEGLKNNGQGIFVEPYFDGGLVYVTLSRSFTGNNGNVVGVISVDMILPQLQKIIDSLNHSHDEQIYVTSQKGSLLAHPLKDHFLSKAKPNANLLDFTINDLTKLENKISSEWIKSEIEVPTLKWKVIIESRRGFILSQIESLRSTLIVSALFLWLALLSLAWILKIHYKQRETYLISSEISRLQLIQTSKMAALGEMAAGIAHEINNPLGIISGATWNLTKHLNNPDKLQSRIEAIDKAVDRVAKIVNSLKKFSRSSEKTEHHSHNLVDIIKESITLTMAKSNRHSTPIIVDYKTQGPILCNEIEIEQVLINLINNGIDAVKNLNDKWVKIFLFEEGEQVVLRVMDSGKGISQDVQLKLFQPFFTTKIVGEGTGLGLSIVKGILDDHKASIKVLGNVGNTCFEIRFGKAP